MLEEALTNEEAKTTNYVDLSNRTIRFDTKNQKQSTKLPICDAVKRILEDRRDIVNDTVTWKDKQKWVFPARSSRK